MHATLRVLYLHNHCITLVLWVRHLNCSPCWLRLAAESLDDTAHIGVQRLVHRMLVGFTLRISDLHVTYGCPALNACYDCYVYLLTLLEYTYGCVTLKWLCHGSPAHFL